MPPLLSDHTVPFTTLKKRRDFLRLNAACKKFITPSVIVQLLPREASLPDAKFTVSLSGARVGYTVTKKIGNAVVRNRVKRRFREAMRELLPRYARDGQDYVLIARHKAQDCAFSELLRELEFAFSRIATMKVTENTHQSSRKRRK